MEEKVLSIKTLSVEIQVIRVGGNKLTKSVFNQIPSITFSSDKLYENRGKIEIFGFVQLPYQAREAIITYENKLFKTTAMNDWFFLSDHEEHAGKKILDVAGQIYISI